MWIQLEDFPDYFVNEFGEVGSVKGKKWRDLKQNKDSNGYLVVSLYKKNKIFTKTVHRLVLEAFLEKSELQVDHIDGNKANNSLSNLEYVSQKENIQRAWGNGLCENVRKQGENHGNSKLTEDEVREILSLKGKLTQQKIAEKFNIHQVHVSDIHRKKTWRHL